MTKKKNTSKKPQSKLEVVANLNKEIEDLELHDMNESEIERVIAAFSDEGVQLRRERKKIRYQLYRLRTEAEGKSSSTSTEEFKQRFESQPLFDNWRMFGTTWDVAMDDPYRIVHKDKSEQEEWNELLQAKLPQMDANGKLVYPEIKIRKKVDKG